MTVGAFLQFHLCHRRRYSDRRLILPVRTRVSSRGVSVSKPRINEAQRTNKQSNDPPNARRARCAIIPDVIVHPRAVISLTEVPLGDYGHGRFPQPLAQIALVDPQSRKPLAVSEVPVFPIGSFGYLVHGSSFKSKTRRCETCPR